MKAKIMAHLVAGYPSLKQSLEVAQALVQGGAAYLEVQFPFSDPTADGPVIQKACTLALEAGFKVDQGFEMVGDLKRRYPQIPVFIMSYASLVFARGVGEFCRQAALAGASGLIIPDLAPGNDEGLFEEGRKNALEIVPVVVTTVGPKRLQEILSVKPTYVYTAIRAGITGTRTEISPEIREFLRTLSAQGVKVLAGFGIERRDQVKDLAQVCHGLVVGSAFVRKVDEGFVTGNKGSLPVQELMSQLSGN